MTSETSETAEDAGAMAVPAGAAAEDKEDGMFKRNELRRAVLAAVTAAFLCGAPAQAAGWESGAPAFFERAWAWITGWLSPDGGSQEKDGGIPRSYQKAGVCIDPDGCPSAATSGSPVCQGDAGVCIDPNG